MGIVRVIAGKGTGILVKVSPVVEEVSTELIIKQSQQDLQPKYIAAGALEGDVLEVYMVNEANIPEGVFPGGWLYDGTAWSINPAWIDEPDEIDI